MREKLLVKNVFTSSRCQPESDPTGLVDLQSKAKLSLEMAAHGMTIYRMDNVTVYTNSTEWKSSRPTARPVTVNLFGELSETVSPIWCSPIWNSRKAPLVM